MMFPCAYKQLFGIDCPVCGFQRSLWLLLEGNFKASFLMYPPLIPALLLGVFFCIHLINKNIIGRKWVMRYSVAVLVIVMINYCTTLIIGKY